VLEGALPERVVSPVGEELPIAIDVDAPELDDSLAPADEPKTDVSEDSGMNSCRWPGSCQVGGEVA